MQYNNSNNCPFSRVRLEESYFQSNMSSGHVISQQLHGKLNVPNEGGGRGGIVIQSNHNYIFWALIQLSFPSRKC